MKGSNRATVPFGTDFQTTTWKDRDALSAPTHIIKKGTATCDLTLASWNAQYERERERERERVREPRNPNQPNQTRPGWGSGRGTAGVVTGAEAWGVARSRSH